MKQTWFLLTALIILTTNLKGSFLSCTISLLPHVITKLRNDGICAMISLNSYFVFVVPASFTKARGLSMDWSLGDKQMDTGDFTLPSSSSPQTLIFGLIGKSLKRAHITHQRHGKLNHIAPFKRKAFQSRHRNRSTYK